MRWTVNLEALQCEPIFWWREKRGRRDILLLLSSLSGALSWFGARQLLPRPALVGSECVDTKGRRQGSIVMTTYKPTSGSRDHIALTLLHTRPTLHLALAFDPAFSPDIYHLSRCSQFCLVHSTNIYLTAKVDIAARKLPPRSTPSRFNSP